MARKDRHRSLHVGLGRVDEHRIRVAPPPGVTIQFDQTVEPFTDIDGERVLARFTASRPIQPREIKADLRGVAIAPEIQAWRDFSLGGRSQSLQDRMIYTEIFTRTHLENMSLMGGAVPPGGFKALIRYPAKPMSNGITSLVVRLLTGNAAWPGDSFRRLSRINVSVPAAGLQDLAEGVPSPTGERGECRCVMTRGVDTPSAPEVPATPQDWEVLRRHGR